MNNSFKTVLSLCFFWQVVGGTSFALQDHAEVRQVTFQEQIKNLSNDQLIESLERLREQTSKLSAELNGVPDNSATLMDVKPSPPPATPAKDTGRVESVSEIKRNMLLLQELFAEKNRRQMDEPMEAGTKEKTEIGNGSAKTMMTRPGIDVDQAMRPDEDRRSTVSSSRDHFPDDQMLISSSRVVPKIVDAFELGNSLFLAGDLEQALKSYNSVQRTGMSPFDRTWMEFMIACCHRGLGDYDQAAAIYRIVEQDLNGVRFVQSAKEWQDFLKKRTQMNEAMAELSIKSDSLLKRAEALTSEPKK